MKHSQDRILTTHVGSLPRSRAITDIVFGREGGSDPRPEESDRAIAAAVFEVVRLQVANGIDVVSDGEQSKISYATYIKDRLKGFEGDSPRRAPQDLEDFPAYMTRTASSGGTPSYKRPKCVARIEIKDDRPLITDLDNMKAACEAAQPVDAFMTAASPGVIALFQPNEHYHSHQAYLEAIGEAMRHEYEGIVARGFVLQIDSPDLGLGRHTMYKDQSEAEYVRLVNLHVDVLNESLRNVPSDRVRMHVCWGNYEGPHHRDAPMEVVLPIALRAKPQALLFESSNPRHAHEWTVFRETKIPEEKILIPGVIDSVTNFIEHPRLVAERLCRFADVVGRERVIAGTDCGFSTFAGFGRVDEDIVYAKFKAMAEGARLASAKLWGRAS